jgi:hypothetical protein
MINKKNKILLVFGLFLTLFLALSFLFIKNNRFIEYKENLKAEQEKLANKKILEDSLNTLIASVGKNTELKKENFVPPSPPSINRMKIQGCVTDGMLNVQSEDAKDAIDLINRSNCYYLHRSIETWLEVPNFEDIKESISKIEKKEVVYGKPWLSALSTARSYSKDLYICIKLTGTKELQV